MLILSEYFERQTDTAGISIFLASAAEKGAMGWVKRRRERISGAARPVDRPKEEFGGTGNKPNGGRCAV
jgi:hypothetical protein